MDEKEIIGIFKELIKDKSAIIRIKPKKSVVTFRGRGMIIFEIPTDKAKKLKKWIEEEVKTCRIL